jgi:hypothetical protein
MLSRLRLLLPDPFGQEYPSCILVLGSESTHYAVQHIVPEDCSSECLQTRKSRPGPFTEPGMKEQSRELLGEISTTTTGGENTREFMRMVRAHVTKSLENFAEQKGDASVVEQELRSAAIQCMEQWAGQERSGDVVCLYTVSLVRIVRRKPGPFLCTNFTSLP